MVNFSLGGFTALIAAVGLPEQVVGLALLNSAGQFGDTKAKTTKSGETFLQKFILKPLKEIFQRVVLGVLFWQSKQPGRIESVLKNVCYLQSYLIRLPYKVFWNFECLDCFYELNVYHNYMCILRHCISNILWFPEAIKPPKIVQI